MQLENADAGVGGKPHREGGLPQKLEPGHKNYGGATKVCHRPQESTREHMIQIQIANTDTNTDANTTCSPHDDDQTDNITEHSYDDDYDDDDDVCWGC